MSNRRIIFGVLLVMAMIAFWIVVINYIQLKLILWHTY